MSLQARLDNILLHGNLTVADLARWFDRPHATVRTWVRDGKQPGRGPLDAALIEARLRLLESMLKKHRGLPVPALAPAARIAHMGKLKRSTFC